MQRKIYRKHEFPGCNPEKETPIPDSYFHLKPRLSPLASNLYALLFCLSDRDGNIHKNKKELSKHFNADPRTLAKYLKELEHRGFVVVAPSLVTVFLPSPGLDYSQAEIDAAERKYAENAEGY